MSFGVKAVNATAGAILLAAYVVLALGRGASGPEDIDSLRSLAEFMLVFAIVGVVAIIAVNIIYRIAVCAVFAAKNKDANDGDIERSVSAVVGCEDEMDKLINLKSQQIGYACVGMGIVATLFAFAYGDSPALALNILFASLLLGVIAEGFASCGMYARGVRHG
ncbi:MAG: hypothetical protein LBT41_01070 [Candidatus Methanoplasma sp.]|jgi:hypothetical protein|nr:hypothetical protein [Candidatus Methanoplasma sp.]